MDHRAACDINKSCAVRPRLLGQVSLAPIFMCSLTQLIFEQYVNPLKYSVNIRYINHTENCVR